MTEDEMVGWHHQFNGYELGQSLGDSEGQGGLGCWSCKESDIAGQLNNNNNQENYENGSYTNIYNISHQEYTHQNHEVLLPIHFDV